MREGLKPKEVREKAKGGEWKRQEADPRIYIHCLRNFQFFTANARRELRV